MNRISFSSSVFIFFLVILGNSIAHAVTWDSGGLNDNLSTSENWLGDPAIGGSDDLTIASTSDTIVWDNSVTTYSSLDLASGFGGSVTGVADTNLTITNTLTVNAGTFSADALITVTDYAQGSNGILSLDLDHPSDYGRITATGNATVGGTLTINQSLNAVQSFTIFNVTGTINGTFEDIQLPTLSAGLVWDLSRLYSSGIIEIIQTPGAISDSPQLWLDITDAGSVVKDGSNLVSKWIDKSGQNNHANRFSSGSEATWTASQLNGLPGLVFDGSGRYYEILNDASLDVNNNFTLFAVASKAGVDGEDGLLTKFTDSSNKQWGIEFYVDSWGNYYEINNNNNRHISDSNTSSQPFLMTLSLDDGVSTVSSNMFVDGVLSDSSPRMQAITTATGQNLMIGGYSGDFYSSNRRDLTGTVYEFLFFNNELSSSDRQAVELSLISKYRRHQPRAGREG